MISAFESTDGGDAGGVRRYAFRFPPFLRDIFRCLFHHLDRDGKQNRVRTCFEHYFADDNRHTATTTTTGEPMSVRCAAIACSRRVCRFSTPSWTHTLPDGRVVRAILVGRWVVSLWFKGEMVELWEDTPYGVA
jgi:hypothetical protein